MAQRNDGGATRDFRTLFRVGVTGDLTDGQLLDRFLDRSGEASELAFEAIVRRHGPMVLRTCRAVLRHEDDARDAFQATFLVLVRKAKRLRVRDSLGPWIQQVAHRTALGARSQRARRHRLEREAARPSSTPPPPPDLDSRDLEQIILDELSRLPSKDRAVLSLCALAGRTNEQAARELGLPVGTVQSRLHRARARLRDRLARRGITPTSALVASALSSDATASVPLSLIEATATAAVSFASCGSLAASAPVIALVNTTLRSMLMARFLTSTATILVLGSLVVGGGTVARSLGTGPGKAPPPVGLPIASLAPVVVEDECDPSKWYVEGVVVDDQEVPVPDAVVSVVGSIALAAEPARTDDEGRFLLALNQPSIRQHDPASFPPGLLLRATARGGDLQGFLRVLASEREDKAEVRVVAKPAKALAVRVVGPDGEPEPRALVECFSQERFIDLAETNADGLARFRLPIASNVDRVFALKSGVGSDFVQKYPRTLAEEGTWILPEEIDLTLDGLTTARVRVVDSKGLGLPGVEVRPNRLWRPGQPDIGLGSSRAARVLTDDSGVATFDWLPPNLESSVAFTARLEMPLWDCMVQFDPSGDPDEPPTIRSTRPARLSGTVRLPDGSAAPGVLVTAGGLNKERLPTSSASRTGADGSFSMPIYPGYSYTIWAATDRFASVDRIEVEAAAEGEERDGVDIRLGTGTILRGQVTDGPNIEPRPEPNARVLLRPLIDEDDDLLSDPYVQDLVRLIKTDSEGRYSFRVGPGSYLLRGSFPQVRIDVTDEEVIERDFRISYPYSNVPFGGVVRVGGRDGEPLAGAIVEAREDAPRGRTYSAETDDDGRFTARRLRARVLLFARNPEGSQAGLTLLDADDDEAVVVVGPSATATGRVIDRAGEPLAGVQLVSMIRFESAGPIGEDPDPLPPVRNTTIQTDETGAFTITGLVPGHSTSLRLIDPNRPTVGFQPGDDSQSIRVDGPEPIDLGDIVYDPPDPD